MQPPPLPSAMGLAARRLVRRSGLWSPIALTVGGYLVQEGWHRSFRSGRSVDRKGAALPWYTYACTRFLEGRLAGPMRVFEYGAGMSSLWYGQRVHEVTSVEHDPDWAALIRSQAPANCRVILAPTREQYLDAIAGFAPYDIVVVDGEYRPESALAALDRLTPDGVIIWDNSTWPDFSDTYPLIRARGYRRIGFAGLGPVNRHGWETSVLYRDENCLGI